MTRILEEWGEERLIEAARDSTDRSAIDIVTAVVARADEFTAGAPRMTIFRWSCLRCSEMSFLRGLVCFCISFISIASQGQSPPVEWTTFTSHGKPISCAVYSPQDASATIIVLRGVSPSGQSNGNALAQFFVEHGYRVLLPDYVNATSSVTPTAANFRRWAQVVDDMVADLVARPLPRNKIIALAGQDLGASVALLAASNKSGIAAVAEWSGSLPNEFFRAGAKSAPVAHSSR